MGFAKVVRDETEKRKAHDAVIESERRFRMLVDGVTDYSIFMLSPEGIVTNWNSGARRIKGYTADEIVGCHFSRFYTPEDTAAGAPQRALDTAARESANAVGEAVAEAINTGFLPALPDANECTYCDYKPVCGPYEAIRTKRKKSPRMEKLVNLRKRP